MIDIYAPMQKAIDHAVKRSVQAQERFYGENIDGINRPAKKTALDRSVFDIKETADYPPGFDRSTDA